MFHHLKEMASNLLKKRHKLLVDLKPEREKLTGKWHITLVCPGISPFQYRQTLSNWERPRGILKCYHSWLSRGEFCNVRMLLELKTGTTKVCRWRCQRDSEMRLRGVGNLKVHISLELHRLDPTIAK